VRSAKPLAAVRLRDITEQAGVSVNTVSRALTEKPDINIETVCTEGLTGSTFAFRENYE
jgi:hypothetical protein